MIAATSALRVPEMAAPKEALHSDGPAYHSTAVLLLETGRYLSVGENYSPAIGEPSAFRNPGLPVTLALLYAAAGKADPSHGRFAVGVLSLLALPAIFWCGATVFGDRRVGALAVVAFAGGGDITHASTSLMPEGLAACGLLAGVALLIHGIRAKSTVAACGAGALCGLAILFRVHLLLAVILIAAVVLLRHRRLAIVFLCSAALLPAAWMARNARVLGMPTLSTQTISLWLGHGPFARGGWSGDWPSQHAYLLARHPDFDGLDEVGRARLFQREAWREFKEHPLRSVLLVPKKIAIALSPWSYLGIDCAFALVLPLALVGIGFAWSAVDRTEFLLLLAPIAGVLAACALVFGEPRFRCVVDGFFALFAAYGGFMLFERLRVRFVGRRPTVGESP